jgi:hypothetical protein
MSVNRTQTVVLSFWVGVWLTSILLVVAAPDVVLSALQLRAGGSRVPGLAFLVALTAFLGTLSIGVVRRWRWMFWLVLVAFLAGGLRIPASVLELTGMLPITGPAWYVLLQAGIGFVQLAIGLAMLSGLRRAGVWGPFRLPGRARRAWRS